MRKYTFLIVLVVVGVAFVALVTMNSNDKIGSTKQDSSAIEGALQETAGPWRPLTDGLVERVNKLNFPPVGNESFHQHALLQLVLNGTKQTVPADIGLGQIESPLHTHDESGAIHMEAARKYPFTLGQFFTVWGVKFSSNQLGSYKNTAEQTVQVYVNGKLVDNPVNYQLQEKDKIIVGYGKTGEVPTVNRDELPKNL